MAPTFYLNKTTVKNILPGSLWQLQGKHIVLVDEDQFVAVPLAALPSFEEVATQP